MTENKRYRHDRIKLRALFVAQFSCPAEYFSVCTENSLVTVRISFASRVRHPSCLLHTSSVYRIYLTNHRPSLNINFLFVKHSLQRRLWPSKRFTFLTSLLQGAPTSGKSETG